MMVMRFLFFLFCFVLVVIASENFTLGFLILVDYPKALEIPLLLLEWAKTIE